MTAVVTDIHYRMSLALIRDLAEAGVRVVCVERGRFANSASVPPLGFYSKRCAEARVLPDRDEAFLEALFDLCGDLLAKEGERPALLPVGAATLALLGDAAVRTRFESVCGLCVPTAEQLDLLNSKKDAAALAQRVGVPVPQTLETAGRTADELLSALAFPCVVKPLCGEKLGLAASERYAIVRDPGSFRESFARFTRLAGEEPVVQEYLAGDGFGCSVLAEDGRVLKAICHRRVREYPVSGGPSSCCACVSAPALEAYAAAMTAACGYTGLAMFEFKNGADGAPRLLEVNPRIWGTFPLTRVSGSGIPWAWFARSWARGNPDRTPPAISDAAPRACRMQFGASDLKAGLNYARAGRPGAFFAALGDFFSPAVRDGLWEWSDPRPGAKYYVALIKKEGGK